MKDMYNERSFFRMIKTLMKSVREYKLYSVLAPLIIAGEVVRELLGLD